MLVRQIGCERCRPGSQHVLELGGTAYSGFEKVGLYQFRRTGSPANDVEETKGVVLGNAVDQQYEAAREAALTNRRIVYYDEQDRAIEAIPSPEDQHTKCRKVTKREWDRGHLVREWVEEICEGEKFSRQY